MQMTADEICRSYKNAVDPKKQIGILAELNATDKASIKAILIDAGLMEPEKKPGPKAPQTKAEMNAVIAKGLQEGLSIGKIAEAADCSRTTVKNRKREQEKPQTVEQLDAVIAEGIRKGLSVREIAEHAGCAENTVRRRLEQPEAPEKPRKTVRSVIPVSAQVTAVIHAIPENAGSSVKLKAFDLCKELLEGEAL